MEYTSEDYPKPATLKWAMLVVLLVEDAPMFAHQIDRKVARLLGISEKMYGATLSNGKQYVPYRLGWERTKCKNNQYIEKVPGMPRYWRLTERGRIIALRKEKVLTDKGLRH